MLKKLIENVFKKNFISMIYLFNRVGKINIVSIVVIWW